MRVDTVVDPPPSRPDKTCQNSAFISKAISLNILPENEVL